MPFDLPSLGEAMIALAPRPSSRVLALRHSPQVSVSILGRPALTAWGAPP